MPETTRTPIFSRYEILEELGSGGMGTVYKARQKFVGRLVAFKVLPPALRQDAEALQRFEREAEALGRLKHPHVVTVFDAGIEGGFPYLAMEFVQGQNLREVLRTRGRLSLEEVRRLGIEMAEALDHVQGRGLVHRDVKPSNIIIDPNGRAVLTDFGIAFAATLPRITQGAMGTPEFMSPEQADGQPLDIRSDLYSLGVVLHECLAGTVPFVREGDSLTSLNKLLQQILHAPPPRLAGPAVPAWLADAVQRCMEKDPARRFQRGTDLAHALREGLASTAAPADTLAEAAPPPALNGHTQAAAPAEKATRPAPEQAPAPAPPGGPAPTAETPRTKKQPASRPERNPAPALVEEPPRQVQPAPRKPPPAPEKRAKDEKKSSRPRARTAFKSWLVLGLVAVAFILFQIGPSIPLADGLLLFNFFSFTPAVTGALVTHLASDRQKVGRGVFAGLVLGLVCSLLAAAGLLEMAKGSGYYPSYADDEMILFVALLLGGGAAALSAVITGIFLTLKFRFSG